MEFTFLHLDEEVIIQKAAENRFCMGGRVFLTPGKYNDIIQIDKYKTD